MPETETPPFRPLVLVALAAAACVQSPEPRAASAPPATLEALVAGFTDPPPSARPDAFWTWLNGHTDAERLTAELESAKEAGLARLQVWDVKAHQDPEGIVPVGPAFLSDEWLDALAHADAEAQRLGMDLGMLAASGWNAGGPWVPPEDALLRLYASEVAVAGPVEALDLPFPDVADHCPKGDDGRPVVWDTVAVQATRATDGGAGAPTTLDLTGAIDPDGRVAAGLPEGAWTVRWIVYANSGQRLIVPSPNSDGLQIDFFDADDSRRFFTHVLDALEGRLGPLAETSLRYLEVDSLELEGGRLTAWTEDALAEFTRRFGYDARPYLALLVGAETAAPLGERFLHDWTRMFSDLIIENHYALGDRMLRERGLLLAAEAGGPGPPIWHSCPVDSLGALGAVGLMRGEFWPKQRSMYNVKEIACAAHTYGQTIVDAESFTSWRHWRDTPAYLKQLADQAFLDGLNHITFHTMPHRGAQDGEPGHAYHAGTHVGPGVTWWPMAGPFVDYLSRCSYMLQQGQPVADVCFFQGSGAPAFHPLGVDWDPSVRDAGYDYDVVDVRVLTSTMRAERGRVVLPHGVRYRLLVLPESEAMDLEALRAVDRLVRAGATVLGPPPTRTPGLAGWPECDGEVRRIAEELWGTLDAEAAVDRRVGVGRVLSGVPVTEALGELAPDFAWEGGDARTHLAAAHRRTVDEDIWFVVNENERWEEVEVLLRSGRSAAAVLDPVDGSTTPVGAGRTADGRLGVRLTLAPGGAAFVVLHDGPAAPAEPGPTGFLRRLPTQRGPGAPASDVALSDTPNGPAWISSGASAPASEFIEYDLGEPFTLAGMRVWNYQHHTRGLLTRGIKEVDVAVSVDGEAYAELGRFTLRKSPSIGERGYGQLVMFEETPARHVRLTVVSNHSDDWSGHTDVVALGRVAFLDPGRHTIPGVTVRDVSSGTAHDPADDALRAVVAASIVLDGPWTLDFEPGRGAPARLRLDSLGPWSEREEAEVRHFSGLARYRTTFEPPSGLAASGEPVTLDLGRLAGVARVTLNGVDLGIAWTPPYAVDATAALEDGENELAIEVAGTWHNRLVGDAGLAPGERVTATNIRRSFTPDTPLVEAGLIGPVTLRLHD